jgi:hypothetical protein
MRDDPDWLMTMLLVGCEDDADVGTKSRSSSSSSSKRGGSGRSKTSSNHWHRHPNISPQKARLILHHGAVKGHALTDKQRRLFGFMASKQQRR